jgi:hypothetical protein
MKQHLFTALLILTLTGCGSEEFAPSNQQETSSSDQLAELKTTIGNIAPGTLQQVESDALLYMREEEKLAHDIYLFSASVWNARVFTNIASSESTHMAAMLFLLDRYQIDDPVSGRAEGEFENSTLQDLYDKLQAMSSASLIDALLVGAEIEEIDLIDIQLRVDQLDDNPDIELVYQNLMKGSRNHLRAFVNKLQAEGVIYQPIHLDQNTYQSIIETSTERGFNGK